MANETDARMAIDRLLSEAGWEIEDKVQVSTDKAAKDGCATHGYDPIRTNGFGLMHGVDYNLKSACAPAKHPTPIGKKPLLKATPARSLSPVSLALLGLAFIMTLGGFLRLYPPLAAGFPINDGGMFVPMIEDLHANGYALPYYTSYNYSDIPYAYPPLGFYLGALLSDILGIPVIRILQLLPAITGILTIPAFYWLCMALLDNQAQVLYASFAFAVLPPMLDWLIMGAALTRTPGLLFTLVVLGSLIRLYRSPRKLYLAMGIAFSSLAVLTHPIMAWFTAWSSALIFFVYGRNRQGLLNSIWIILGVIICSAPWWLTILLRHGTETFLAAFGKNTPSMIGASVLLLTIFANTPLLDVLSVVGLMGIFLALRRRRYFLVIWLLLVLFIQRRFVNMMMTVPFAMLIAIGLDQLVLPGLNGRHPQEGTPESAEALPSLQAASINRIQIYFLVYIMLVSLISGFIASAKNSLSTAQAESMEWARQNTPPSSHFAVLTGEAFEGTDLQAEWFPALSQRHSLNTVQGTEWLPEDGFYRQQRVNHELQACYEQDTACIAAWAQRNNLQVDYLYVGIKDAGRVAPLLASLHTAPTYQMLFENSEVTLFQNRRY